MRSPYQLSDKQCFVTARERSKSQRIVRKIDLGDTGSEELFPPLPRIKMQALNFDKLYVMPFPFEDVNEQILEYLMPNDAQQEV